MTGPIVIEIEVACTVDHAFRTWTEQIDAWWPKDHNRSGDPDTTVTIEPKVGGRIYELTSDGHQHDWGEVTEWKPPDRLGYLWHIAWERTRATDVLVTFEEEGTTTRVRIEQRGWERFGDLADRYRSRNEFGWSAVLERFEAAVN